MQFAVRTLPCGRPPVGERTPKTWRLAGRPGQAGTAFFVACVLAVSLCVPQGYGPGCEFSGETYHPESKIQNDGTLREYPVSDFGTTNTGNTSTFLPNMLRIDIKAEEHEGGRHQLMMSVHRQTPGPFADYLCSVADRQCLYEHYPRWSETVAALVARAALALNIDELLPVGERIARLKMRVLLVTSGGEAPLLELRYRAGRMDIIDAGPPQRIGDVSVVPRRGLVSQCLRLAAWGQDGETPPATLPQAAIYGSPGSDERYLRIAEIPEPARSGLESLIRAHHWGQPVQPGQGECVWLHDWERFLAG